MLEHSLAGVRLRSGDGIVSARTNTLIGAETKLCYCNNRSWRMFPMGPRLCENSCVGLPRGSFFSITLNRKRTALAAILERGKKEKTVLRPLCSCTFSHSLGQHQTLSAQIRSLLVSFEISSHPPRPSIAHRKGRIVADAAISICRSQFRPPSLILRASLLALVPATIISKERP